MKKFICAAALMLMLVCCKQTEQPFFFVQLSDPQIGFKEPEGDITKSTELLSKAVDAINRIQPAFVIVTGDLTHERFNETQLDALNTQMGKIDKDIPVYYLPGNHDFDPKSDEPDSYIKRYGYENFSFVYNNCAFIGFNTDYLKEGITQKEDEQFSWIQEELEKDKNCQHIFLFTHCPIIKESIDEEENYFNFQQPYRKIYMDLCEKCGVDAVFSGHYHRTRHCRFNGVDYYTTGPTGLAIGDGFSGMNIVTVCKDSVTSIYVRAEDAVKPF